MSTFLKGLRTLLLNAGIAGLVAFLAYLVDYDWTQHVSPSAAVMIVAGLNFGLRFITDTPVAVKGINTRSLGCIAALFIALPLLGGCAVPAKDIADVRASDECRFRKSL